MDLTKVSTKRLMEELVKREHKFRKENNKDWYFFFSEADSKIVYIVRKRFWHTNHHLEDGYIEDFVDMPLGFSEIMESCFDFDCSQTEAESKLLCSGFTKLLDVKLPS